MDFLSLVAKLSLDSKEYETGLDKAKGAASKIGGGIATGLKVVGTAVAAATTAVAGFGAASVKTGMSFDSAMSQVAATMGMSVNDIHDSSTQAGQDFQKLSEFAMEMGRTTQFTATDAADALNYMALAGYDAQTSMMMLPNVLNLAAAGGMELATASDMITDTQTAFGLSIERTTLLVDEMAKASSTGNTNVQQLGDAFLTVGGLAKELNGGFIMTSDGTKQWTDSTQQLEIALTAMANAGIKGAEAGTHMRNAITKLSDPTDAGYRALESLGVDIFDKVSGNMRSLTDIFMDLNVAMTDLSQEKKIKTITALFNARDLASAEALLGAVEGRVVKLGDEVMDLGSAYEKYGEDIYDTSKGFEIIQSSWDGIGQSILDAKIKLEDAEKVLNSSGVAWKDYGVKAQAKIREIAGDIRTDLVTANMSVGDTAGHIAEAYGIGLQDAIKAVQAMKDEIDTTAGAAETMSETMRDNLSGDMDKFNSALEGAQILIAHQLDPTLRAFVQTGTDGISKLADAFSQGGFSGAMSQLGTVLSESLTTVTSELPHAVEAGIALLEGIGQGISDNIGIIGDAFLEVGGVLTTTGVSLMQQIADGMATFDFADTARNIGQWLSDAISSDTGEGFIGASLSIIGSLARGIGESYSELAPIGAEIIANLVTSIINNIDGIVEGGIALIEGITEGMNKGQLKLIEMIPQIFVSLAGAILRNAPKILAAIIKVNAMSVERIVMTIPTLITMLANLIGNIVNLIATQGDVIVMNAVTVALNVVTGVINAIVHLPETLAGIAGHIVGSFINALGDAPAKTKGVFDKVIPVVVEFGKKFIAEAPKMAKKFVEDLPKNLHSLPSKMRKIGKDVVDALKNGVQNAWDSFISWIKKKAKSIVDAFLGGVKDSSGGKSGGKSGTKNSTSSVNTADIRDTIDAVEHINAVKFSENDYSISHGLKADTNKFDYDELANTIVRAFEKADFGVEIDGREFGRMVRRAVTT